MSGTNKHDGILCKTGSIVLSSRSLPLTVTNTLFLLSGVPGPPPGPPSCTPGHVTPVWWTVPGTGYHHLTPAGLVDPELSMKSLDMDDTAVNRNMYNRCKLKVEPGHEGKLDNVNYEDLKLVPSTPSAPPVYSNLVINHFE